MTLDLIKAALLGILQGLTEFLPISSSAHLLLLPWVLGWEPYGLLFDVLLHGGTLAAILIYFRKDWAELVRAFYGRFDRRQKPRDPARKAVDAILIGTLPAVLFASIFGDWVEHTARTPLVTVFTLSFFAVLLWWADRRGAAERKLDSISWWDGLLIGLAQALALIPGVSRSGVTITAALFLGFERENSARFSFLLAGPIIAGAALKSLVELLTRGDQAGLTLPVLAVGIMVSFITGFLCIKYFLRFLRSRTFLPFVLYRFCLAALILYLLLVG